MRSVPNAIGHVLCAILTHHLCRDALGDSNPEEGEAEAEGKEGEGGALMLEGRGGEGEGGKLKTVTINGAVEDESSQINSKM